MKAKIDYTLFRSIKQRQHEEQRKASKLWVMMREPDGNYEIFKTIK